jgi:anti-anti-sigma factor
VTVRLDGLDLGGRGAEVPQPVLVVAPERLVVDTTPDFRTQVYEALDLAGGLVVDLSAVRLCDLTGLGVLVGARLRARRLDRLLVLSDPSPAMRSAARRTRLDRVLLLGVAAET